jgi:hypothetical protein
MTDRHSGVTVTIFSAVMPAVTLASIHVFLVAIL